MIPGLLRRDLNQDNIDTYLAPENIPSLAPLGHYKRYRYRVRCLHVAAAMRVRLRR